MRQLCEIDIPGGWEFERFGKPNNGEHVVHGDQVLQAAHDWDSFAVIVKPAWQWPSWLKANWLAMDEDETWTAFMDEPEIEDGDMWGGDEYYVLNAEFLDVALPVCNNWRTSKRARPT
jgi:hypothetical protein